MQAVPPPAPAAEVAQAAPASPALPTTLSQRTDNLVIASSDRPMLLAKGGHREQAILSYVLYIVNTTTVLRSAAPPGPDRVRWSYAPYIQRSLCVISITGVFACGAVETTPLEERSEGEAPLTSRASTTGDPASGAPAPGSPTSGAPARPLAEPSAADVALARLSDALRQEATAKFDEDDRLKFGPMLKAAGVHIRPPSVASSTAGRSQRRTRLSGSSA